MGSARFLLAPSSINQIPEPAHRLHQTSCLNSAERLNAVGHKYEGCTCLGAYLSLKQSTRRITTQKRCDIMLSPV
ncbi:hypothetical protein AOLI_G00048410 [Acnodon oligacanthus]